MFEGKDPNAVTDLMSHLNSYKSDIFKGHISKIHLNNQVQNSDEVDNLKKEIAELRTELETNKPVDLQESYEYTNQAIIKTVTQLNARFEKIINNITELGNGIIKNKKTLSNINSLIELKVKEEVNGVISQTLGQV